MKTTLGRWVWCALLALPALVARADNAASAPAPTTTTLPAPTPSLRTAPATLPVLPAPPDGVEFSTGDPEAIADRTMEIQAEQRSRAASQPTLPAEQEQNAASDNDWMLRDYTARLKKAGLAQTADSDPTTFSQPSDSSTTAATNADPLLNSLDSNKAPTPQPTKPEISSTGLTSLTSLTSLQPLLPPLNSPALNAPRDAWGSEPVTATPTDLVPPLSVTGDNAHPSSSLDVPGLTAAESGMGPEPSNLSFQDPLPDESTNPQRKQADQNNFLVPTAPTSDVSEFFKKQSEALQPPVALSVIQPVSIPAKPIQPTRVRPMAKPAVSGLRSHVDDPFDILKQ